MQLELIEPLEGPSIYTEHLASKGEGLHHIQSRPENVDEVLAAFQERGVDVLMSGKVGDGAFYYLDTESLLGLIFEVVKPRRTGLSPETTYPSPMT
jgi:selenophosphate synthetase-related protein